MLTQYKIHVVTGAKVASIEVVDERTFKVKLKNRPIDGKANAELIKTLATYFKVAQSKVRITKGLTSKHKLVTIDIT